MIDEVQESRPKKKRKHTPHYALRRFTPEEREAMFMDWMENHKSYAQIAVDFKCDHGTVLRIRDRESWFKRRDKIVNDLQDRNNRHIAGLKQKVFDATAKLINMTANRISDIETQVRASDPMGFIQLVKFVADINDFEKLVKTLYLIENDGVEKKKIEHDIPQQVALTDDQAMKLLNILTNEDNVIDVSSTEIKALPEGQDDGQQDDNGTSTTSSESTEGPKVQE